MEAVFQDVMKLKRYYCCWLFILAVFRAIEISGPIWRPRRGQPRLHGHVDGLFLCQPPRGRGRRRRRSFKQRQFPRRVARCRSYRRQSAQILWTFRTRSRFGNVRFIRTHQQLAIQHRTSRFSRGGSSRISNVSKHLFVCLSKPQTRRRIFMSKNMTHKRRREKNHQTWALSNIRFSKKFTNHII